MTTALTLRVAALAGALVLPLASIKLLPTEEIKKKYAEYFGI